MEQFIPQVIIDLFNWGYGLFDHYYYYNLSEKFLESILIATNKQQYFGILHSHIPKESIPSKAILRAVDVCNNHVFFSSLKLLFGRYNQDRLDTNYVIIVPEGYMTIPPSYTAIALISENGDLLSPDENMPNYFAVVLQRKTSHVTPKQQQHQYAPKLEDDELLNWEKQRKQFMIKVVNRLNTLKVEIDFILEN
mmetsp:Transcript_2489/g.3284  ORF Transcript_2489/g.3284 Transcript_2489/m.3284 type:complete len:194 (-) Transcript_2489:1126-1707(-)